MGFIIGRSGRNPHRRKRRKNMERHIIKIDGERYDTVYLLRVIADQLEQSYPLPLPVDECNPVPTEPTRFSIHWEVGEGGEWWGYLVAYWEYQCEAYHKSHEYKTPILRITVTTNGVFHAKCILTSHPTLATFNTLEECKKRIEDMAFAEHMMDDLYFLCVKEDANPVKTIWWK
jgi:hypothetical protein